MRRNVTYHHTGHHSVKDAFQQVLSRSLGLLLKRDRMWRKIISLCLVVIIGGAGIGSYFFFNDTRGGFVPLGLSIVMSMMLTALPLLADSRPAWASLALPTCHPNGPDSTNCSVFPRTDPALAPNLRQHRSPPSGNAILQARDEGAERAGVINRQSAETKHAHESPPIRGASQ